MKLLCDQISLEKLIISCSFLVLLVLLTVFFSFYTLIIILKKHNIKNYMNKLNLMFYINSFNLIIISIIEMIVEFYDPTIGSIVFCRFQAFYHNFYIKIMHYTIIQTALCQFFAVKYPMLYIKLKSYVGYQIIFFLFLSILRALPFSFVFTITMSKCNKNVVYLKFIKKFIK